MLGKMEQIDSCQEILIDMHGPLRTFRKKRTVGRETVNINIISALLLAVVAAMSARVEVNRRREVLTPSTERASELPKKP